MRRCSPPSVICPGRWRGQAGLVGSLRPSATRGRMLRPREEPANCAAISSTSVCGPSLRPANSRPLLMRSGSVIETTESEEEANSDHLLPRSCFIARARISLRSASALQRADGRSPSHKPIDHRTPAPLRLAFAQPSHNPRLNEHRAELPESCSWRIWGLLDRAPASPAFVLAQAPLGKHLLTGATVCGDPISWFQRAGLLTAPTAFVMGCRGSGRAPASGGWLFRWPGSGSCRWSWAI